MRSVEAPRYTMIPLPAYRFVPGLEPHPRRDPRGHSHGLAEPRAPAWTPDQWRTLEPWLYGIDLYNRAYWWECHEQLEALWLAAGRTTVPARFVQGFLRIAAACLNRYLGKHTAALGQADTGAAMLERTVRREGDPYMGLRVAEFVPRVSAWFRDDEHATPHASLEIP